MSVSDERLDQLAYDPMMCNISEEVQECLAELVVYRNAGKHNSLRKMKPPEYNPDTGEELEEGCYMMATAEDGLCDPITGCPGCAQERRRRNKSLQDNTVVWNKGWKATEEGLVKK
jgi:hypothetical protein